VALLGRRELLHALEELDQELGILNVRGEVFIVGGAAMAIAYDTRVPHHRPAPNHFRAHRTLADRADQDLRAREVAGLPFDARANERPQRSPRSMGFLLSDIVAFEQHHVVHASEIDPLEGDDPPGYAEFLLSINAVPTTNHPIVTLMRLN